MVTLVSERGKKLLNLFSGGTQKNCLLTVQNNCLHTAYRQ